MRCEEIRFRLTADRYIGLADPEARAKIACKHIHSSLRILVCVGLFSTELFAQVPSISPAASSANPAEKVRTVERSIELAGKGRCGEALPVLEKLTQRVTDKEVKYRALMATVRCAMSLGENRTAANALFDLKRDYPKDPEVLYMISEYFLGVAESTSQELAAVAPNSYQTRELEAETLESQGKWAEAIEIYRKILEEHPKLRGIHYQLGRAVLSQAQTSAAEEDAKKEFERELEIDPVNAAAEYWLGEIARRDGKWDEAIQHFSEAAKLNSNFGDALLALGTSLNSAGRFADAIPPLERYVKMSPKALAGHYQLYIAYLRSGRKEDAVREMDIHRQLLEKRHAAANSRVNGTPP